MVEVLRVSVQESDRGQFGLLGVQCFGLLKLKKRTDVVGLGRIDDNDTFALLELPDEVVAVNGCQRGYGQGSEKPEPWQSIALREELGRVETLARLWYRT